MTCRLQAGVLEEAVVCVTSGEQGVADEDPGLGLKDRVVGASAKSRTQSHPSQTGGGDDLPFLHHPWFLGCHPHPGILMQFSLRNATTDTSGAMLNQLHEFHCHTDTKSPITMVL